MKNISGIYKIICVVTNKVYIGSAVKLKIRKQDHFKTLRTNKHRNPYLQNAWNKHGEENFSFDVIEYCEKEKLLEREQFWINETKCCEEDFGYNINPTAGSNLGKKFNQDFRDKARARQLNKVLSIETRLKMSKSQSERKRSDNIGALISAGKRGKGVGRKLSEYTIKAMKEAQSHRRMMDALKKSDISLYICSLPS